MKISASAAHVDWTAKKQQRNLLLLATDKMTLVDYPISEENREEVLTFRSALRVMFEGANHPDSTPWPTVPAIVSAHVPQLIASLL